MSKFPFVSTAGSRRPKMHQLRACLAMMVMSSFAAARVPFFPLWARRGGGRPQQIVTGGAVASEAIVVRTISIQGSSLPRRVVSSIVRRGGLLGRPFDRSNASALAADLGASYGRRGFVLAQCTMSAPDADGVVTVAVDEPKCSVEPVVLHSFKEAKIGDRTTLAEVTHAPCRTRASTVAFALGLKSGRPFRWHSREHDRLIASGLFKKVALRNLTRAGDGGVALHLDVVERDDFLSFNPEVAMNLGSRSPVGALSLRHGNLFGTGMKLGAAVRYDTKASCPQGGVNFEADRFGRAGGLSLDVFQAPAGAAATRGKPGLKVARRRGLRAKVRLTGVPWGHVAVATKREVVDAIGGATAWPWNAPVDAGKSEVIECASLENCVKFASMGASLDVGLDVLGGQRYQSPSPPDKQQPQLQQPQQRFRLTFATLRGWTRGAAALDDGVRVVVSTHAVAQSADLPRHEKHAVPVRGADTSAVGAGAGWLGGSVELQRALPGGVTGTLFLDEARAVSALSPRAAAYSGLGAARGSCGAGLLLGPIKVEVVRHLAVTKLQVGLR